MTTAKPQQADSLADALARLQANLPEVGKERTANAGSYSYSYADLAACSRAVLPKLGEQGLSFSAKPTLLDGEFVLVYVLRHTSGDNDGGVYPLPDPRKATPQSVGSAISYGRRYCLLAVTGLAPAEDDDDGAAATHAHQDTAGSAGTTTGSRPGGLDVGKLYRDIGEAETEAELDKLLDALAALPPSVQAGVKERIERRRHQILNVTAAGS